MIDTRILISQQIIFNNTGIEWHKLQHPIAEYCSNIAVHCLGKNQFYDTLEPTISTVIDNIHVDIWLKFSTEKLQVEAICIKGKNDNQDIEENSPWGKPIL